MQHTAAAMSARNALGFPALAAAAFASFSALVVALRKIVAAITCQTRKVDGEIVSSWKVREGGA